MEYTLSKSDTIVVNGHTLRRIKYKNGVIGGYVESKKNLPEKNNKALILHNAKVYDNALIIGNAKITGNAEIFDRAVVSCNVVVSGCSKVYEIATISGNATICGGAKVHGCAVVTHNARVFADANVLGGAHLGSLMQVGGKTSVTKTPLYIEGLCEYPITGYNNFIQVGCILHTIEEWKAAHKIKKYEVRCIDYDKCVEAVSLMIKLLSKK